MHRLDGHAGFAQQIGWVAAPRAPERIVDHLDARFGDGFQIDQLGQPLQKRRLHVGGLKFLLRRGLGTPPPAAAGNPLDRRFNLLGHFRQRRRAVGRGVLDAVVLRRIVRRGEVDRAGGLQRAHGVGNGRRGRGFGNHDRRDACAGEHARRFGHKALAQEARIAPHQHAVRRGQRLHVRGNPATASRILATVNSSATMARHPEVPNLIAVLIAFSARGSFAGRKVHTATPGPDRQASVAQSAVIR